MVQEAYAEFFLVILWVGGKKKTMVKTLRKHKLLRKKYFYFGWLSVAKCHQYMSSNMLSLKSPRLLF